MYEKKKHGDNGRWKQETSKRKLTGEREIGRRTAGVDCAGDAGDEDPRFRIYDYVFLYIIIF